MLYDKECKTCGYRLSSYLKSGYLNCPDCYASFEKEIAETLVEIQGATVHKGKRPRLSSAEKELFQSALREWFGFHAKAVLSPFEAL